MMSDETRSRRWRKWISKSKSSLGLEIESDGATRMFMLKPQHGTSVIKRGRQMHKCHDRRSREGQSTAFYKDLSYISKMSTISDLTNHITIPDPGIIEQWHQ